MTVIEHCREQARRAVRERGWTTAVADDAADAASGAFEAEIERLSTTTQGAVKALGEIVAVVDDALDTWTFVRPEDYRRVTEWLGRVHAIATTAQPSSQQTGETP